MKKEMICLLIAGFCTLSTLAQTPDERVAALETKITQLEQRIAQLEAALLALTVTPTPAAPAGIPPDVDQAIRAKAEKTFTDNFSYQESFIKSQREAYLKVQSMTTPAGIPDDVFQSIRQKAADTFSDNYQYQESYINKQVESYLKLHPK